MDIVASYSRDGWVRRIMKLTVELGGTIFSGNGELSGWYMATFQRSRWPGVGDKELSRKDFIRLHKMTLHHQRLHNQIWMNDKYMYWGWRGVIKGEAILLTQSSHIEYTLHIFVCKCSQPILPGANSSNACDDCCYDKRMALAFIEYWDIAISPISY